MKRARSPNGSPGSSGSTNGRQQQPSVVKLDRQLTQVRTEAKLKWEREQQRVAAAKSGGAKKKSKSRAK